MLTDKKDQILFSLIGIKCAPSCEIDKDDVHRIKARWLNRSTYGFLCDCLMLMKLKRDSKTDTRPGNC